MAVDEFKNLGFQEEAPVAAKVAVGGKGSRLDELRRENEELKRQHQEADKKAAAAAGGK
jgi:cytochrome c oxidase assembly protein subunit 19